MKQHVDRMVMQVADRALQILGGYGYIREYPVELWLRNARGFAAFDGLGNRIRCDTNIKVGAEAMISFEIPEFIQNQMTMIRMVAEQAMRPYSRQLDENEHEAASLRTDDLAASSKW